MATSSEVEFSYAPLSLAGREIRLLRLIPSASPNDLIEGELVHISLESGHRPYEALSYEWGDAEGDDFIILLDGCDFRVRKNLFDALRRLRRHEERILWIDAICIDQSNISERNHQVGQMRSIYSKAWRVVVWLGEASDDSDHAMDFLTKLAELGTRFSVKPLYGGGYSKKIGYIQHSDFRDGIEWSGEEEVWGAVEEMFFRPYWKRVWIVQEIILGIDVRVCCGSKTIPWDVFLCGTENTGNEKSCLPRRFQHSMPAKLHFQRRSKRRQTCKLYHMLATCKDSLSFDPRDKIFGLLGIADDCLDGQVEVDYSKTTYEVYMDTSRFIRKHASPTEFVTLSALVYASLGLPIPPPSMGTIEDAPGRSFSVIGHILSVTRRNVTSDEEVNASSLDISLPQYMFDKISSPDFVASLFPYGIQHGFSLGWTPYLLPKVQLDYSRHSSHDQTACTDHWPLFLDAEGTGCISKDISTFSFFLFKCKTVLQIDLVSRLVRIDSLQLSKVCKGQSLRGYLPTDHNFGRLRFDYQFGDSGFIV